MTKPPPPEGYRDWCDWYMRTGMYEKVQAMPGVFSFDNRFELPVLCMGQFLCWALDDYDALRRELDQLRADAERAKERK